MYSFATDFKNNTKESWSYIPVALLFSIVFSLIQFKWNLFSNYQAHKVPYQDKRFTIISDVYLVYFQMNYGLLLYSKLAGVDVGNASKKGKNMKGIIT